MGRNGVIWVWIGVLIGAVQGGEPAADGPVSKKNAAVSEAAGEQDVLARLAELEAQIAKLTQDAVDDRESTGFLSLLEERFDMGGEIEVEFVDSQRENNPGGPLPSGGESSPYVRLDKLRLSPRVTFTGRRAPLQITAEGDIDFLVRTTSRARVKEFYLAIEGVHSEWAESRLRIGLDDAFMKPPNMIDTEAWPLAVTAFSRNETLGFFWRTRLGDRREALGRFSLQASLTNGFRLRDRDPGEDDAFEMIGQEGRVGGRGSALREYGFGVGWERRWFEGSGLIDRIDTDISCFYTNDSLQSDDDLVPPRIDH